MCVGVSQFGAESSVSFLHPGLWSETVAPPPQWTAVGPGTVVRGLRLHERYQNGQLFELLRFTNPPTKHSVPKNQNGIDTGESLSARAQKPSTRPAAIRIHPLVALAFRSITRPSSTSPKPESHSRFFVNVSSNRTAIRRPCPQSKGWLMPSGVVPWKCQRGPWPGSSPRRRFWRTPKG
jgi:hypothetical protein